MPIYIPESDEIDWEMFIEDKNERELTREVYENINQIDEYRENHPDIPEKIYIKVKSIYKHGIEDEYLLSEKRSVLPDNMIHTLFIACILIFLFGKMFCLFRIFFTKIDAKFF
jgi:hypothetical protein